MTRAIVTAAAIVLLMACENGKQPAATGVGTDGDDTTTTGGPGVTGQGPGTTEGAPATDGTPGGATDDPTGDTTCSFVCDTTGGTDPGGPTCDNWAQDCPDEQKCAAYADDGGSSWNNLKCVPAPPDGGQPGDPCTVEGSGVSGIDSCAYGSMCWDVDGDTGQGTCVALCTGSPDAPNCAPPDTTCVIANEGVLNICLPKCDPLIQDCQGGDLCLPNPVDPNGFVCVLDASGESGVAFDPCEYANACDQGFVCQDPALAMECDPQALGCCLPFCKLSDPDCPGQGQECLEWYTPGTAPPGYADLGLCGIPM